MFHIIVAVKLILGLLALVLVINLTEKGNLTPTSVSNQVQNHILGGIVDGVICNTDTSIPVFMLILAIRFVAVLSLRRLKKYDNLVKRLVDERPMMLISHDKIDADAVHKVGTSANDLSFGLRMRDVYATRDVRQATFEQDGQLIIISFGEENPEYPLITDGSIQPATLEMIDKDEDWLLAGLKTQGITDVDTVSLAEYGSGKITITEYGQQGLQRNYCYPLNFNKYI